ncbi:sporulation phosphorelay system protein KapB [Oceanobacillus halophilus]|uniref:Kinase n=1 Tax=Oceanobacillus halophilus TaxID=930130 RepID=A0A494ZX97_9BACI|nr:sporulation phosphorelay system protein KapB [Oceanobacillus halophilus]RKQ29584.1 kinase [Oceanobacillus halophilus]
MAEVNIGDIVKAHYNSGTYIGKVIEDRGQNYLIEVHAVHKHPLQGDLHNYGKIDVVFHERKALFYKEKMNVKKPAVHLYEENIPSYGESLKKAVITYKEKLEQEDSDYSRAAISKLNDLEENYYKKSYYNIKS